MNVKRVPLVQLGIGGVGRALVQQVLVNRRRHAERLGVRLNYVALTDRSGAMANASGLADERLASVVQAKRRGAQLTALGGGARSDEPTLLDLLDDGGIVIDVTASAETLPLLREARKRDLGIVLANKLPLAGAYETFRELTVTRKTRFETTVAAALPVISTLQSYLLDTGDEIKIIRGCVSGTLNLVCRRLEQGEKLSQIVKDARAHGHTEPDPREDLAGRDAARKALILARVLGQRLEFQDVEVEPLYPAEMDALDVEAFLERLGELDAPYAELSQEAREAGRKLRYVIDIEVSSGCCRARLEQLAPDDELLRPGVADSAVAFTTERYSHNALIVSGKGSGPALTASGVLADVLMLASLM